MKALYTLLLLLGALLSAPLTYAQQPAQPDNLTALQQTLAQPDAEPTRQFLGILRLNEQQCHACLQQHPTEPWQCQHELLMLADNYALYGYEQAGDYYEKSLIQNPALTEDSRRAFVNYAVYCIRYRQFDKATSVLDQLVTTSSFASQRGNQYKMSLYEFSELINLYVAARHAEKGEQLLKTEREKLINAKSRDASLIDMSLASDNDWRSLNRLGNQFMLPKLQKFTQDKGYAISQSMAAHQFLSQQQYEPLLTLAESLQQAGNTTEAQRIYEQLLEATQSTEPLNEGAQQMGITPWKRRDDERKAKYWPLIAKRLIDVYERTGQSSKSGPILNDLRKAYPAHLQVVKSFYQPDFRPIFITKSDDEITQRSIENEGPATFNFALNHCHKYPALANYAFDNALMLKTLSYASVQSIATGTNPQAEIDLVNVRFRDIRQALQPGEAVVEFVSFRQYTTRWTDTTLYAALVLRHGEAQPHMTRLCTGQQLQALTSVYRLDAERGINAIYNPRGGKVGGGAVDTLTGRKLHNLLWKPIADWVRGVKTVYIAPAGEINKVAFAALPIDRQTVLADSFRIRQVFCSSSLINRNDLFLARTDPVTLFGDIRYDVDSLSLTRLPKNPAVAMPRLPFARQGAIKPLTGTKQEIETIRLLFTNARSYTGLAATEAQARRGAPTVLHFATHGFYFPLTTPFCRDGEESRPVNDKVKFKYGDYYGPLLRSGLLMAGASHVWQGGQPVHGLDDGILTAHEIAYLKLPTTKLVVLSACETALGDVRGNEAVIGFQRAFRLAGVQRLLVSLWKVPDNETAEFMKLFYEGCVNQQLSVSTSFYKTQQFMRGKHPSEPYKWAAFTLIE